MDTRRSQVRRYQAALTALPVAARHLYAKHHRRPLHLAAPRRFTEKVNWRIVHDRRDLLAWTCDKLLMKEAASRIAVRTPHTYWTGRHLDELERIELPDRWVLKPNHRTGLAYFGRGRADVRELRRATSGWLDESQWRVYGEWAYGQARPALLVEEWMGDSEKCLRDYKVFVFDGVPAVIQVDRDRFDHHTRCFYRAERTPLDAVDTFPLAAVEAPPVRLPEVLDVALQLGTGFDFMRIDLYVRAGEIYLGEVTSYPCSGLKVRPDAFDHELGQPGPGQYPHREPQLTQARPVATFPAGRARGADHDRHRRGRL